MGIQDIRALETRISDAIEEYVKNPKDYGNPVLRVRPDEDGSEYMAEIDESGEVGEGEEAFPVGDIVSSDGEIDYDRISDIANSFIFVR